MEAHGAIMVIQDGVARADLDAVTYQTDSGIAERLLRTIRARLAPYEFTRVEPIHIDSNPTLTITHQDGQPREIHLQSSFASIRITDHVEIQIYRNGVLIQDTALEGRDRRQSEAELLSRHADDDLLSRLLASKSASKSNPSDEFTHLYEILEALQSKFVKPATLINELGIEKAKVRKFHSVCNDPSTASRHRGLAKGPLKEPSADQYHHARTFAWDMILSYAQWLEKKSAQPD
ncbi:hypothetical protein AC138_22555 [Pseudomonas putida]|jgi:hypothetical protein|nr:hypothetical protein AC138_22555 [Pseudomonas putida]KMY31211.1 hypothetical protein AA993_20315 [Pseudomonas putida]PXZ45469.1 hypothetical protein DM483_28980 [Pseudomonas sp. SMT-1]